MHGFPKNMHLLGRLMTIKLHNMNTERTPEQIAAERYPQTLVNDGVHATFIDVAHLQREAWLSGLQVGAEFAEWVRHKVYYVPVTQELLQIFLTEKYGK